MFKQYKLKMLYKVIQLLNLWCIKNEDKYNQMIVIAFQGLLNQYQLKEKPSFNEGIYAQLKQGLNLDN